MPLVLNGATSGSTTIQATDAVTQTITLPNNSGTVLTTASTFAGTGPAFSAYSTSNQTISASTLTKVLYDTEEFDTNNNFASSRFTPTVAGYYQINGCFSIETSTGTQTRILPILFKNGAEYKIGEDIAVTAGIRNNGTISSLVYLNGSTDYVEIYAYVVGGTPILRGYSSATWFNGSMVRSA